MSRHQPHSHLATPRHAWLVIVLFGTLPSCNPESTAKNSVDVSTAHSGLLTVSRVHTEAATVAKTIEELFVPDPSPSEPVVAVMTVQPKRASAGETVEVLVRIRIASAHFIHAKDDAGGPYFPVAVTTTLPAGLEPIGTWQVPTPEMNHGNSPVYLNSVLMRRLLKVGSQSEPGTFMVIGELHYQVCTEEICWPPRKLELSAPLVILSQRR